MGDKTYVRIPLTQIKDIDIALANTSNNRETIKSIQQREGYDFIINGGYFWNDSKWIAHSINLLIANKKQISDGYKQSKFGMVVYDDMTIEFKDYQYSKNMLHMIGGSPAILKDNKIDIDNDLGNNSSKHPRSAIGMSANHLVLATIDGRNPKAGKYGATIRELAQFMKSVGCSDAIALDGGGSTILMNKQKVLNQPLENRAIHNAIGVRIK